MISKRTYRVYTSGQRIQQIKCKHSIEVAEILPQEKLMGVLPKNEVTSFLVEASKDWDLTNPLLVGLNISKSSGRVYRVFANNGVEAAQILSFQNEVLTITVADFRSYLQNRYFSGRIQKNGPPSYNNNRYDGFRYLNEAGITGKNITVIFVDSGLEVNNAYFYRKDEYFAYRQRLPQHSKIEIVYPHTIQGDSSGHGTHVAGILLGKSSTENKTDSLFNGIIKTIFKVEES